MKKFVLVLSLILVLAAGTNFAQAVGDYGSVATGNWNSGVSLWKKWDGTGFNTAGTVIPTKTDNVWIQGGFTVTVTLATCLCNNLHITGNSILTSSGGNYLGSPV